MSLYSHYSGKLGLICLAIYLIMLIKYRKVFFGVFSHNNSYLFIWVCMMLYSVLGFLQYDTYHYSWAYEEMVKSGDAYGVEHFYFWLTQILPNSYLLWRFAIWGTASTLVIITAKRLSLNANVVGFMIPLLFLTQLTITRGCLGLSLMVLSSVLLLQSKEKKRLFVVALSIVGIGLSLYLHKSMVIFVSLLVLTIFLPVNKRTILVSLILFPFLYSVIIVLFQHFSLFSFLNEEQEFLITRYQESTKDIKNVFGIIETVFEKASLILFMIAIIKRYLYDRIPCSKAHYFIFKYSYVMVYVSFLFLGQEVSSWISTRSLHAATFALVLCASHTFNLWENDKRTKLEKIAFLMMFISTTWTQYSFISHCWN